MNNKKISKLQLVLTIVFISALLISNIITSKQILLPFNITMTGAIFVFPITYILSDIFSEVYGYKYSRFTCYMGFAMNLFMVAMFTLAINWQAPSYWNGQEAFELVLGNTPRILFASLLAFLLGDLANDLIFKKMKEKHIKDHKGFCARAILSSFAGELIDSLVFLPIAFIGLMPVKTLIIMTITQVFLKTGYEFIILPITNMVMKKISNYER